VLDKLNRSIGIKSIVGVEMASDLEPLWGNWVFRGSVILQAGEPGISKTTYNYSFSKAIVDNSPFLGVKPAQKNLKILMVDWESSDSLIKSRMRSMGYPRNYHNFFYCNHSSVTIIELEPYIDSMEIRPDIIFLDPLRYAFGMRDENDNAEASRQAKFMRGIADKYNCAVIIVHHSSKGELEGWKKASGASARTSLADISMNFDQLNPETFVGETVPEEYKNIFRLSIPKNRLIDDKFVAFIKKVDKSFELVEPPPGYKLDGEYKPSLREYGAQRRVFHALSHYVPTTPQQIHETLGGDDCLSIRTVYNVLCHIVSLGDAERTEYGKYRLTLENKRHWNHEIHDR